jgi:23S rRNA (adenine2030-N6)-methyltransferase
MNYRHLFHAGGFGDVLKHVVLALLIAHLKAKDKPFTVLDTHAGIGRYDLARDEARRTKEFEGGIAHLFNEADLPAELASYLAIVQSFNPDGRLRWYPGSPCLVRALLRPGDRLIAVELHPEDAETLAAEFARDRQVKVHRLDGYQALKAFLPPTPRRGLVLIDPPFEENGEFDRMVEGLKAAHRRWATGIYALWYPVKDRAELRRFHDLLRASNIARIAVVELSVLPREEPETLTGCGLVLVNPPFGLLDVLKRVLSDLVRRLAVEGAGASSVEWLVPEPSAPKPESDGP